MADGTTATLILMTDRATTAIILMADKATNARIQPEGKSYLFKIPINIEETQKGKKKHGSNYTNQPNHAV